MLNNIKNYIINAFKTKKLRMIGFILTWVVPLVFLLYDGMKVAKTSNVKFELWAIPCLGVILLIYYRKLRQKLRDWALIKNARGVSLGAFYYLINTLLNVALVYVAYLLVNVLINIHEDLKSYLVICISCLGLGGVCYIIDEINKMKPIETTEGDVTTDEEKD